MEPLPVVKDSDPLKDGGAGGELAAMHQLAFEAAPEAFHGRVIVTVARSAHAGDDAGLSQPLPVSLAAYCIPRSE